MHAVSDRDLLRIWELGRNRNDVERALLLLAPLHPGRDRDDLASLTLGQRNHALLDLRENIAGRELTGFSDCPQCGERNGFRVLTTDVRRDQPQSANRYRREAFGDYRISFRLPNSHDLIVILQYPEPSAAYRDLLHRLIRETSWRDDSIAVEQLPEEVLAALADRMTDLDPQAEIRFGMTCFSCEHQWSPIFDIMSFLWTELDMMARMLLLDVITLAREYGWSETEILSMSAVRRSTYLDLAQRDE